MIQLIFNHSFLDESNSGFRIKMHNAKSSPFMYYIKNTPLWVIFVFAAFNWWVPVALYGYETCFILKKNIKDISYQVLRIFK